MNIMIIKAEEKHLSDCAEILRDSFVGLTYFINEKKEYVGRDILKKGFDKDEIYVALTTEEECVAFLWIEPNGIFHWFPYLHILAVKARYRSIGIGNELMKFFEDYCFTVRKANKVFLLVGEHNQRALAFYQQLKYVKAGEIPDLFVKGNSEYLMMKERY